MGRFGTFGGVFTPDVLTILGVIMYLRFGWVVGNAGFVGAVIIILLAKNVTIMYRPFNVLYYDQYQDRNRLSILYHI